MNMSKYEEMKLASPWVIYYRKLLCLFKQDPDIQMYYNNAEKHPTIKIVAGTLDKANALSRLLPVEKQFGNVTLEITIVAPNIECATKADLISQAFRDNPVFKGMKSMDMPGGVEASFALFKKEVVQYNADDISDWYGHHSTLYQDIAKEILGEEANLHYCTEQYDEVVNKWWDSKKI